PRRHAGHPALADRPQIRAAHAAAKARQRRLRPARRRTGEAIGRRLTRGDLSYRQGGGDTATRLPSGSPFSASDGTLVVCIRDGWRALTDTLSSRIRLTSQPPVGSGTAGVSLVIRGAARRRKDSPAAAIRMVSTLPLAPPLGVGNSDRQRRCAP